MLRSLIILTIVLYNGLTLLIAVASDFKFVSGYVCSLPSVENFMDYNKSVSRKIKKLKTEGKPQKQAVAQALSMANKSRKKKSSGYN